MNSVKPMGTDPKIYPYLHILLREKTHPHSPHIPVCPIQGVLPPERILIRQHKKFLGSDHFFPFSQGQSVSFLFHSSTLSYQRKCSDNVSYIIHLSNHTVYWAECAIFDFISHHRSIVYYEVNILAYFRSWVSFNSLPF